MKLNDLKKKVKAFDHQAGFDKTEFAKLIKMMEEEIKILKKNKKNPKIVQHQLTDLLILLMQIAHRYNTNFDSELKKWFEKSQKYLKKCKS